MDDELREALRQTLSFMVVGYAPAEALALAGMRAPNADEALADLDRLAGEFIDLARGLRADWLALPAAALSPEATAAIARALTTFDLPRSAALDMLAQARAEIEQAYGARQYALIESGMRRARQQLEDMQAIAARVVRGAHLVQPAEYAANRGQ